MDEPTHQALEVGCSAPPPKLTPKPRLAGSTTVRDKSALGRKSRNALISDTELLFNSIRDIENGLADGSLVRQFEVGSANSTTAVISVLGA